MQSEFKRAVSVRVVLATTALVLASCSSGGGSGDGNGGGLVFPANDDSNTANPPAVAQPPTTQPPTTQPPTTQPPVAPPTTPPSADSDRLSSLFGEISFILQYENSGDRFRYTTTLSEVNRTLTAGGNAALARGNAGVFDAFACSDASQLGNGDFLCIGIFPTQDLTAFLFTLNNGIGSGTFEECQSEDLNRENGFDACFEDFALTPDGSLEVTVTPTTQTARPVAGEFIESKNAFQAMMEVNDQATRFGTFQTPASDAERARIAQMVSQVRELQSVID